MLLFHLIFYSYKPKQALYEKKLKYSQLLIFFIYRIYNAISLNAAVFAAVCLASLANTALDGFVIVSLSFQIFAFAPKLHKVTSVAIWVLCSCYFFTHKFFLGNVFLVGITLILLSTISPMTSALFSIAILFLLLVFPLWLNMLQGYKK